MTLPSRRTISHYEARSREFWAGTKDHDVTENYAALLENVEGAGPFRILDLGCGPGRDLAYFRSLGHAPTGLDGCAAFCAMARAHAGVFANASLFHVPTTELPRVLRELWTALKPRGVLFSSNPHGHNEEGWNGERYGCYWDLERYRAMVTAAGFLEITHYYRPRGKPREEQPWLATVWRKE